jgi:hypothetical protein
MEFLIPILLGLGAFAMISWVVYVIVDGYRRRERLRVFTDFHGKLMERMGSAREFGEFLQTDGGQRFLETLTVERDHPANRILRAAQTGLVLMCLGSGTFAANNFAQWETEGGFMVVGLLFMTAGFGFVLSAAASYIMSKKLGLFDAPNRPAHERL